jgi:Kef-type K+ transport system membrane component KefB
MTWVLGLCLMVIFALLLLAYILGWALTKLNIRWYKKLCRKQYIEMISKEAIRKYLDEKGRNK